MTTAWQSVVIPRKLQTHFATSVALGRPPAGSSVKQGPHFWQAVELVEQGGWSGGGHLLPAGPSCGVSSGLILQWQQCRFDSLKTSKTGTKKTARGSHTSAYPQLIPSTYSQLSSNMINTACPPREGWPAHLQHFGRLGLVQDRKSSIHDAAGVAMKLDAGDMAAWEICRHRAYDKQEQPVQDITAAVPRQGQPLLVRWNGCSVET